MRVVSHNNYNNNTMTIGDVYMMNFTGEANVQQGWRPGVVFQNNTGNRFSPNIVALPLTSSIKKSAQPTHVTLRASDTGLRLDSMVLCENPETISKDRVGKYLTSLSDDHIRQIAVAHILASSAISFLSEDDIIRTWHRATELNYPS